MPNSCFSGIVPPPAPTLFSWHLAFQKPTFVQELIVSPLDGIVCVVTNLRAPLP